LDGLDEAIIPIEPVKRSFRINVRDSEGKQVTHTVHRRQFAITPAYAFTDYRAQGQTISHVIIDIARPPSGRPLNLFNLYVALSRSSGRETVRLLRDFDDNTFMAPHSAELLAEDDRLGMLDRSTS
ncbi:hypothetical protein C8Q77DRAFT_1033032, partial [Trametes polyzona]